MALRTSSPGIMPSSVWTAPSAAFSLPENVASGTPLPSFAGWGMGMGMSATLTVLPLAVTASAVWLMDSFTLWPSTYVYLENASSLPYLISANRECHQ